MLNTVSNNSESVNAESAKTNKFWDKMGQSLDQWVKSGVSSLATVASLASDTSYYSPGGLMMGYRGDYVAPGDFDDDSDGDEYDEQQKKTTVHRRLDFEDEGEDNKKSETLRLLRSVSFGNDTQIMSKLKELKHEMVKGNEFSGVNKMPTSTSSSSNIKIAALKSAASKRSGSEESNGSLETKINQFYEGSVSREASLEKSQSNSREVTPVEENVEQEDDGLATNLQPPMQKSPSIQIKYRKNLTDKDASSCSQSPARTPVTQNDPLGALSDPSSPQHGVPLPNNMMASQPGNRDSPKRACSEGFIVNIMAPKAVGGNHNGGKDLSGGGLASKTFHRSSTLPNYSLSLLNADGSGTGSGSPSDDKMNLVSCTGMGGSTTNVVSGLSAISSSLKNPFGRYSPARLSLRKAGTSLIESTIGGKKAEAFMEGFNQFKSVAAVTAKKKLDEFKEAMSNNNYPPGRNGPFGGVDDYRGDLNETSDWENPEANQWASVSESYLDQILTTDGSTRASFSVDTAGHVDTPLSSSTQSLLLANNTKPMGTNVNSKKDHQPVAINISMTTCSMCHNCSSLLFDEEIMGGWTAEDSNLNTRCPHCKKWEVPFLEVTITDFRHYPVTLLSPSQILLTTAPSLESMNSMLNPSRRTSINPTSKPTGNVHLESATPLADTKDRPHTVDNSDILKFKSSDNDSLINTSGIESISHCVNGESPSCLDPLGVLEERSRRNSPEPEEIHNAATTILPPPPPTLLTVPGEDAEKGSRKSFSVPTEVLNGVNAEPVIVPYLSPLVLRKELENVLELEGDSCLVQCRFVDEHPILYWNLVWFFHRANLTSHIKGLTLLAKSLKPTVQVQKYNADTGEMVDDVTEPFSVHPSWDSADHRNVLIKCRWDNSKFHNQQFGVPLYIQWLESQKECAANKTEDSDDKNDSRSNTKLLTDVLKSVQLQKLSQICPQLLFYYHKEGKTPRHYPAYRDILFLALTAGGREFESYGYSFDREYRDVYSRLRNSDEFESMGIGDTPPSDTAIFCRRFFRELIL